MEDIMGFGALRIVAAWLALSLAAPGAHAADPIPFKIGISAPVVTILPVWMAETGGFYAKEGLKVEVINMEGGTRGLQVLLSGEIQGMHVGLAPALLANIARRLVEAAGLTRVAQVGGVLGDPVGHLVPGHVQLDQRLGVVGAVAVGHLGAV